MEIRAVSFIDTVGIKVHVLGPHPIYDFGNRNDSTICGGMGLNRFLSKTQIHKVIVDLDSPMLCGTCKNIIEDSIKYGCHGPHGC